MSYRTITVDGNEFKWKVGRKFIEVRSEEPVFSGKSKLLVDRPIPQKRWGLIAPRGPAWADDGGLAITIYESEGDCQAAYEAALERVEKTQDVTVDEIEQVVLPKKSVVITPSWIRNLIEANSA